MKKKVYANVIIMEDELHRAIQKALKKEIAREFDGPFFAMLARKSDEFSETLQTNSTKGYCYSYAMLLSWFLPNCKLVHGVLDKFPVLGDDGGSYDEFEHAWVETGKFVYDTSAKCVFDKEQYYKIFAARAKQTFSKQDLSNRKVLNKLCSHALHLRPEMANIFCKFKPFSDMPSTKHFKKEIFDESKRAL